MSTDANHTPPPSSPPDRGRSRRRVMAWVVAALAVTGLVGFTLGRLLAPGAALPPTAAPSTAPATQPATPPAGATQMYTCSMHPQVRSTNPDDKCPICGMSLIPVPTDGDDGEDEGDVPRLRLTARAVALMQVRVQPAERRDIRVPVRFYGRLDYDETRLSDVNIKVSGWIEKLHVDFVGSKVKQGQPLLDIYSPELYATQEEYLIALRHRDSAAAGDTDLLDAARTRLAYFDITDTQIAELEERGKPVKSMTVRSPHDGVVIERGAYEGMKVDPGMRMFRLADLSRLWVQLEAYETDLPWLAIGQQARFTTQANPGDTIEGEVVFIDPIINERRRTARVRVEVDNADGRLKPGSFVTGRIEGTLDATPLIIPRSAPLITGRRAVVYVQLPDEDRPTYEPRQVVLGPRADDWYVVREGLEEGELVVTHGAFKIDSELQIRGRPSMMQPEGGSPPTHDHGPPGDPASGPGSKPADDHRGHAQPRAATEQEVADYPLKTCVVSGLALGAMGGPIRIMHDGKLVLLCCDGCLPTFEKHPQPYLDKLSSAGTSEGHSGGHSEGDSGGDSAGVSGGNGNE